MPGDSSESDQFRQQQHAEEIAARRQTPAERQERNLEAMIQRIVDRVVTAAIAAIQLNGTGKCTVTGGNGVFSIDVQATQVTAVSTGVCNGDGTITTTTVIKA